MTTRFGLTLVVNHACNLRCTYCYTGAKISRPMPMGVGKKAIDRAFASLPTDGALDLAFFGGEPLLEAGLILDLVAYAKARSECRNVALNMTTNGTIDTADAWSVMSLPEMRRVRWAERAFAVFGLLVALSWLTIDLSVIVSPSMEPTLRGTNPDNGDRVLTEKITRWVRRPRRWEVITFRSDAGDKRMKRVVNLPGDHVHMRRSGELLIDGRVVAIPDSLDLKYLKLGNLMEKDPVPCGNGYYVLGDDLKDSDDSRFNGPVAPHRLIGRSWLILWPLDRFGFVR